MRLIFLVFLVMLNGCVTSTTHTRKADKNRLEIVETIEAYLHADADTETKKIYANQLSDIRQESEEIVNQDPSAVNQGLETGLGFLGAFGIGGGGLGVAALAFQFLRSKKMKMMVSELIETPERDKCLEITRKYKHV